MPRETGVVKRIRDALEARGAWVLKTHGSEMQIKGIPDLIGCWRGRFFGLEAKRPDGGEEPTKLQKWTLAEIRKAGGMAASVTSVEEALIVCSVLPLEVFVVPDDRMAHVRRLLPGLIKELPPEVGNAVLHELGYSDSLTPDGMYKMQPTDLQLVAITAALMAAKAGGGTQVPRGQVFTGKNIQ